MPIPFLQAYARRVRELLRANPDTPEPGLAPAFQRLVEELLSTIPGLPPLTVSPEFAQPGVGRPDIALIRPGAPPRAFIELKAPAKPADPARWRDPHDRRQRERLCELAAWASCNFGEFRLFSRDEEQDAAAVVPARALRPDTDDRAADRLVAAHDPAPFLTLLGTLARADPPAARDAPHLAELLAHASRIVRSAVAERVGELRGPAGARHPLVLVRDTFRNVLFAHPEAGGYPAADFDALFASAFAQTLAFGLLLVREASGRPVGSDAWTHMPDRHPLMRAALRVLSEPEVTRKIGVGVDVLRDTVNSFAPEIMAAEPGGRDPILYFYEDFLATFDPDARERYGVYYTPVEVVRYMTGALDRALRDRLGLQGLRDPAVTILDPAVGTGTFLLGVAERVRDQVQEAEGGPEAGMALRDLAGRMYGFELLVGPYAVAHYRLHHALSRRPADEDEDEPQPVDLPRLGIYLADTLADPTTDAGAGGLGIPGLPIDAERREAHRIKTEQPILAIIGNPPYRRLEEGENETLVGRWMDGRWDDLKRPVREAGHGNQLNTFPEFSIAFWRWALWKLFEADAAPRRGVVAFITNRKFLTGWPYAGLRRMLRERFDRIEVIDLRGDVRAGVRGDVASDQGVFNIQVGTAITVAVADGTKPEGALADVTYADSWAHDRFSKPAKLEWLLGGAEAGTMADAVPVDRGALDDMRPEPFQNGEWLSIRSAFVDGFSGVETTRDHLSYGVSQTDLATKLEHFHGLNDGPAKKLYSQSRKANFAVARARPYDRLKVVTAAYRPLDSRVLFNEVGYVDWPRPQLQAAWGRSNLTLFAMPNATRRGPGVWCHGNLPDRHAFRGSYGGYAFPLYDRRAGPDASNISPALLAGLGEAYGEPVAPEDVFDAVLALLSASSYTRRFAEDLEDVFPHIPFPADPDAFRRAVAVGREIRALETFAREPEPTFRPRGFLRLAAEPTSDAVVVAVGDPVDGAITLCADGSGRITGIAPEVWRFAVSGYRVLPRWLEGRIGQPADLAFVRELRDVAARIAELIHWFGRADAVLDDALASALGRDALGFTPVICDEDDGDD